MRSETRKMNRYGLKNVRWYEWKLVYEKKKIKRCRRKE